MSYLQTKFNIKALFFGFILLFLVAAEQKTIDDFQGGILHIERVEEIYELNIGMNDVEGYFLGAFNDLNEDKYTDLILIQEDLHAIDIFYYEPQKYVFEEIPEKSYFEFDNSSYITSVVANDFNNDALVDLFVTKTSNDNSTTYFEVYLQQPNEFSQEYVFSLPVQSKQQPTFFDYSPYTSPLFLYNHNSRITVGVYENGTLEEFDFTTLVDMSCGYPDRELIFPNSNQYLDLNTDCRADLFLMTTDNVNTYLDMYMSTVNGFCLINSTITFQFPSEYTVSPISFGDFNFDGAVDMTFILQKSDYSEPPIIHIVYNSITVETSIKYNLFCKNESAYASDGTVLLQPFQNIDTLIPIAASVNVYTLNLTLPDGTQLYYYTSLEDFPNILRVGDVNMDAAPDLVMTVFNPNLPINETITSLVLINNYCHTDNFTANETANLAWNLKCRFFAPDSKFNLVSAQTDVFNTGTFDFGELGNLGFITAAVNSEKILKIFAIFNWINSQNYFLKNFCMSGYQLKKDKYPYGTIKYGATFVGERTILNGTNIPMQDTPMRQPTYTALMLPFTFFGLNKTNNYVQYLNLGIPTNSSVQKEVSQYASYIIPNSQLFFNWNTSFDVVQFVNPTKKLFIIAGISAFILLVLGIIICKLNHNERKEDALLNEGHGVGAFID